MRLVLAHALYRIGRGKLVLNSQVEPSGLSIHAYQIVYQQDVNGWPVCSTMWLAQWPGFLLPGAWPVICWMVTQSTFPTHCLLLLAYRLPFRSLRTEAQTKLSKLCKKETVAGHTCV